jgi:hypothetical protein
MISKENLGNILEKHFSNDFEDCKIEILLNELETFSPISNKDYIMSNQEILLKIYLCFLFKELDFTLTVGMINENYTRINKALKELRLDFQDVFSNSLCFQKNLTGIVFTHKKIKFHYWTKGKKKQPVEINTISYKLINPAKGLGKFKIFINAETMLNCLREIETAKVNLFDMRTGEVISRPAKIDLESNPFASIIEKPSNPLEDN